MPQPLVSCIMPTANRRRFVPFAIDYFLRQDYERRELVILDDGEESIADLVPEDARIRYIRQSRRRTVGAKRNACIEASQGEIIAHWDDDDWHAPGRLSLQVDALLSSTAQLCGIDRLLFYAPDSGRAWEYHYGRGNRPWLSGSTLVYRRSFWTQHHFPDVNIGEDTRFVWSGAPGALQVLDVNTFHVGIVHARNTSPKRHRGPSWREIPAATIHQLLRDDRHRYDKQSPAAGHHPDPATQPADNAPRVIIGIHVCDEPSRVHDTLRSIGHDERFRIDVAILADGPGDIPEQDLQSLPPVTFLAQEKRAGAAACFNSLLRSGDADFYLFLENGARFGPGCLSRLLDALVDDPKLGLAGPSTNRHWSLQEAFAGTGDSSFEIEKAARTAAARYGRGTRPLRPLYCLGDFCFVVRRDLVASIGGADEGFGLGPCWEMDYCIRAERAGFGTAWVGGAYLHRASRSEGRARQEAQHFEAAKRRYQDNNCGIRLEGWQGDHAKHCRGEACPHFAPPSLIRLRRSFERPEKSEAARPARADDLPLVSCLMPTGNRLEWVLQAISYFKRQNHPRRELIIIDDSRQSIEASLPCDPRIRYIRVGAGMSIGEKRNRACEAARGTFLLHWDDDDWHGPDRLSRQIAPLVAGVADVTALRHAPFYDVATGKFWDCSDELHARLFTLDVHGGTLAYRRELFSEGLRFPHCSLAEDAEFLRLAVKQGARLEKLPAEGLYIYVRHGRNSWRVPFGDKSRGSWRSCAPPEAMTADIAFYARARDHGPHRESAAAGGR